MNELTHLAEQKKIESLTQTIPEIGRLRDETKKLMKLVKKGKYNDAGVASAHSLIERAKNQVERLKEHEEIESLEETIPDIWKLKDQTSRLMKLVKKSRSQDSNMLDVYSLIALAKEKVEQLTNNEKNLKDT